MRLALVALVCLMPLTAVGQTVQFSEPRPITTVAPLYDPLLRASGVQGEALVGGVIRVDGAIVDIRVIESSRSDALDAAALAAVSQWTFASAQSQRDFRTLVTFYKDDPVTLMVKRCSEVLIDVAYFRRAFPEASLNEMPLRNFTIGTALYILGDRAPAGLLDAFEPAVAWCQDHPDERYFDVLQRVGRND